MCIKLLIIIDYVNYTNANTFIEKLQKQYNTLTGETGIQLSGGEKQRLDIARNFIKRPGLLLLDEATSNLDSESEKKIQDALSNIAKKRTTIIIAHRLSTVLQADQIIFVDNGFITGTGTHKELMNSHQKYKKMIELQSLN